MSEPRHDAPGRRLDLLYDPAIPTPTHAERARTLAARGGEATLSTLDEGHPYGSFVLYAMDGGHPVLLISGLAAHTKNLVADPRCSLLIREAGADNPLAVGRLTLMGRAEVVGDETSGAAAYVARHPDTAPYASYRDFAFWRITVDRVRYIGGFGRMSWVGGPGWSEATPDPLDAAAQGILDHMNADHVDAMRVYCAAFSKAGSVRDVTMTSVDRYGFEMSAVTADGPRPVRVAFPGPVTTPDEVRAAMVALVREGRAKDPSRQSPH